MGKLLTLLAARTASTPAFAPTDLSGLTIWLDASDAATITQSSSRVSAWADKSGNANNAVQATGSLQPLYVSSAIGSKSAVKFRDDGTNRRMAIPDNATLNYTTFSSFVVIRRHTDIGSEFIISKWSETSPSASREHRLQLNTDDTVFIGGSVGGNSTNATATTTATIPLNENHIVDGLYDGTNVKIAIDNGTQASAALASVFNGTADFYLSGRDGGTNPFGGFIGEVLFYKPALSAGNRTQVLQYLASKWGITIA